MTNVATELKVADLMTIDPIVIAEDASVEEAEGMLRHHRITGLPVVDLVGRLVGVISQTDLLFLAIPSLQALIHHRDRGIRIGEVMSSPPVTIDITASVRDAARMMDAERLHRLVAVDQRGRPIGVIAAMDFVRLAAEG